MQCYKLSPDLYDQKNDISCTLSIGQSDPVIGFNPELNQLKNEIGKIPDKQWNSHVKRETNQWPDGSRPLNRASLKLHEIISYFHLLSDMPTSMIFICLCEGPGGFMECILKHRKGLTLGFVLHRGLLLRPRRQRSAEHAVPLPPVAHAQARDLVRSVRQLRLRRLRALHHVVSGRHRPDGGSRRDLRWRFGRGRRRIWAMTVESLGHLIRVHPFFAGLDEKFCALVCSCARNVRFAANEYLLREGEPASEFVLLRAGRVVLETSAPGRGAVQVQTLREGDIVGISWLIPPYRWNFDARALEPISPYRGLFRHQLPEAQLHDIREVLAGNFPHGNERFREQI